MRKPLADIVSTDVKLFSLFKLIILHYITENLKIYKMYLPFPWIICEKERKKHVFKEWICDVSFLKEVLMLFTEFEVDWIFWKMCDSIVKITLT